MIEASPADPKCVFLLIFPPLLEEVWMVQIISLHHIWGHWISERKCLIGSIDKKFTIITLSSIRVSDCTHRTDPKSFQSQFLFLLQCSVLFEEVWMVQIIWLHPIWGHTTRERKRVLDWIDIIIWRAAFPVTFQEIARLKGTTWLISYQCILIWGYKNKMWERHIYLHNTPFFENIGPVVQYF